MSFRYSDFDVIVVGGGHAGIEAALACARLNHNTLLISQALDNIGVLSCNPSIGGISKGNIVREIDALGGEQGRLADACMIQYRLLNKSRGPAVQAPRIQADKYKYNMLAKHTVELQKGLHLYQDTVVDFIVSGQNESGYVEDGAVQAVITARGRTISAKAVILTTGTFLEGKIFIGEYEEDCGRLGEKAAQGLGPALRKKGFTMGRLKTGTPPRILAQSVDYSELERQDGDPEPLSFSFGGGSTIGTADTAGTTSGAIQREQVPCWLTYTNSETHRIIRENLGRSSLYGGKITGTGARYCPSIEDKIVKFAERERHHIFIEPEGINTQELYINGLSSSLPEDIQDSSMRTIPALKNAIITRPAYAVEYDFIDPIQLRPSLETHRVRGLFTAGQINGTSGYEEAGGQGLIAGINAALYVQEIKDGKSGRDYIPFTLARSDAYIGVMIDDLVTLGTTEPYRMFTARAEYRLKLRHDTADERLTPKAHALGLQSDEALERMHEKIRLRSELTALWESKRVKQTDIANYPSLTKHLGKTYAEALRDPLVPLEDVRSLDTATDSYSLTTQIQAELEIRYEHYIKEQDRRVAKVKKMDNTRIPETFDYDIVPGLSIETRSKLKEVRPATLGQASRISGLRPTDIMLLMIHIK